MKKRKKRGKKGVGKAQKAWLNINSFFLFFIKKYNILLNIYMKRFRFRLSKNLNKKNFIFTKKLNLFIEKTNENIVKKTDKYKDYYMWREQIEKVLKKNIEKYILSNRKIKNIYRLIKKIKNK